jgi:DeoR/GlpR family transcriptional regulator of sugar metabolism
VLIGGQVHPERRATLGPLATEFLRDMHLDRAFIGVNGVNEEAGYTVVDFDAAQVKRAMMARAREVIVVADHSKIGEATFASVFPLNHAHVLITDTPIEREALRGALEAAHVEVIEG